MASHDTGPSAGPADPTSTKPVNIPNPLASHSQPAENTPASSTPLEMNNLNPHTPSNAPEPTTALEPAAREEYSSAAPQQDPSLAQNTYSPTSQSIQTSPHIAANEVIDPAPGPSLKREQTAPAIGPSSDRPTPIPKEAESENALMVTLLLTNGARHPYKIDDKYLKKRNVSVEGDNPINLSIYDLKNLIWREWREGTSYYDRYKDDRDC